MAEVIVASIDYLKQQITAGRHTLITDEPRESGGSDSGPDPYSLLLAALGACTSMTLQIYAQRKKWPLERVEVSLIHTRVHADDCADCKPQEHKLDRIERFISVSGPLSEEQKSRLLEIAEHCPVHKTLAAGVKIESYLD
jgi:putative redox protein